MIREKEKKNEQEFFQSYFLLFLVITFIKRYAITPPMIANGNVAAMAVPKAAIPIDEPIHPPTAQPPAVPVPIPNFVLKKLINFFIQILYHRDP